MNSDYHITGNLINAYFICHRKVWLFAHEFLPDLENDLLEIGKLITQTTFHRNKKEIEIAGMKIDLLRKKDEHLLVGEIKKSSKGIKAAIMQLAFYLYNLKKKGINLKGEVLIPKEKKRICIELEGELEEKIKEAIEKVKEIIVRDTPPQPVKILFCRRCAYKEFCWV